MDLEFPKMLFKHGGPEHFHDSNFHTMIVNHRIEEAHALNDGWYLTSTEAKEARVSEIEAEIAANNVKTKEGRVAPAKKTVEDSKPDSWGK